MTLVVPNIGEEIALKAFLNHTASLNQTLKLFANNITPAETDTASTYEEVTGGGYAAINLTGSSWTVTQGAPSSATYAEQTWTFTGAISNASGTVYGYYVVTNEATPRLMWAEKDSNPFSPANSGDQIKLTPKITAD